MALTYIDKQVLAALKKAKGNKAKARTHILAMLQEDPVFLMTLTKPHLQGIISLAVDRTVKRLEKIASGDEDHLDVPSNAKGDRFGLDLLKAIGGQNAAKFGQESASPPVKKKAASSEHVKALKMMASKSKTKPKA